LYYIPTGSVGYKTRQEIGLQTRSGFVYLGLLIVAFVIVGAIVYGPAAILAGLLGLGKKGINYSAPALKWTRALGAGEKVAVASALIALILNELDDVVCPNE
jgi:hypothetical protein